MKDHEIIAKIAAMLDGATPADRATVEAYLRAKYGAPASAVKVAAAPPPAPVFIPYPMPSPPGILRDPWNPEIERLGRPWWQVSPQPWRPLEVWCGPQATISVSTEPPALTFTSAQGATLRLDGQGFSISGAHSHTITGLPS